MFSRVRVNAIMTMKTTPTLMEVGYYEQLILVYLNDLNTAKSGLTNLKDINENLNLNYSTLKTKLKTLRSLELVFMTRRGKEKVVSITEKGKDALTEWENTIAGKNMLEELKQELIKRKSKSNT